MAAGKEISKEEGDNSLTPSSTMLLTCWVACCLEVVVDPCSFATTTSRNFREGCGKAIAEVEVNS